MRLTIFFALLLMAAPFATGATTGLTDDEGDELLGPLGIGAERLVGVECHSPAIDITALTVAAESGTLVVRLSLLDLDSDRIACAGPAFSSRSTSEESVLEVAFDQRTDCPERDCPLTAPAFGMHTREALDLLTGQTTTDTCVAIRAPASDEAGVWCSAGTPREGDDLVWRIPLQGGYDTSEGPVSYDLEGHTYALNARTSAASLGGVELIDTIEPTTIAL